MTVYEVVIPHTRVVKKRSWLSFEKHTPSLVYSRVTKVADTFTFMLSPNYSYLDPVVILVPKVPLEKENIYVNSISV